MNEIPIYIGYDTREPVTYHACVDSIIRHASVPVAIHPLALQNFTSFYDERHTDGSNQFIYSRFLVPFLSAWQGHAIYLDGDMVVNGDIAELWGMRNHWQAAQVVQHDYQTKAAVKFRGKANENYPRKNWSSVILWNCAHYGNRALTPEYVEKATGAHLHRFAWLEDDRLGELPKEWNWLATEYPANDAAKLIHYTLGTPCFPAYRGCSQAPAWHKALQQMLCPLPSL